MVHDLAAGYQLSVDVVHSSGSQLSGAPELSEEKYTSWWKLFLDIEDLKGSPNFDSQRVRDGEGELHDHIAATSIFVANRMIESLAKFPKRFKPTAEYPYILKNNIVEPHLTADIFMARGLFSFGRALSNFIIRGVDSGLKIGEVIDMLDGRDSMVTMIRMMHININFLNETIDMMLDSSDSEPYIVVTPEGFKVRPGSRLDYELTALADKDEVRRRSGIISQQIRDMGESTLAGYDEYYKIQPKFIKTLILEAHEYVARTFPYLDREQALKILSDPTDYWRNYSFVSYDKDLGLLAPQTIDIPGDLSLETVQQRVPFILNSQGDLGLMYQFTKYPDIKVAELIGEPLGCAAISSLGHYVAAFKKYFLQVLMFSLNGVEDEGEVPPR